MLTSIVFVAFVLGASAESASLESYNINPDTVSVSGLSAGAAFATQFHVIHSSSLVGVASFAGVPYYCAHALLATALTCMSTPGLTNVNSLINQVYDYESNGKIDPVSDIEGDKVFVFAGTLDTTVKPGNGDNIEEFYEEFGADVYVQRSIEAEHCQPTEYYGESCDYNGGEFINDCDYYGAYKALDYIYGGTLEKPPQDFVATGTLQEFDQSEFIKSSDGMDDTGYLYIPTGCQSKELQCTLHVVFHGCLQQREEQGDTFSTKSGYIEVGELNNIIMLFPQAKSILLSNPNGCYDWWGYSGIFNYATNDGVQNVAVKSMIDRLIYG